MNIVPPPRPNLHEQQKLEAGRLPADCIKLGYFSNFVG